MPKGNVADVVDLVNAATGTRLSVVGRAAHGSNGGAVYIQWPDGRDGVVTQSTEPLAGLQCQAAILSAARASGAPVPEYQLVVELPEYRAIVQERLPGQVKKLDVARLEAMVDANERFAGLLAGESGLPEPELLLHHERGYRSLETYSERTRRLLDRVRELGDVKMSGDDLLHTDYNHSNVLFDEHNKLTGVIDWDQAAARGDRHFALVKLRYLLAWEDPNPIVMARLDELLAELIDPETLLIYWAHWGLRMVDWMLINDFGPAATEIHLSLAETRLG
jgi:hypothetical protein